MKTSVVNIYSHFLSMHISRVCHASLSKIEILLKPTFRKLGEHKFPESCDVFSSQCSVLYEVNRLVVRQCIGEDSATEVIHCL